MLRMKVVEPPLVVTDAVDDDVTESAVSAGL